MNQRRYGHGLGNVTSSVTLNQFKERNYLHDLSPSCSYHYLLYLIRLVLTKSIKKNTCIEIYHVCSCNVCKEYMYSVLQWKSLFDKFIIHILKL